MGEHRSDEGRGTGSPSAFAPQQLHRQWGSPRLPQAGWLPGWHFFLGCWNRKKRGCLNKRSPNLTVPIQRVYKTLRGRHLSPKYEFLLFSRGVWGQHPGVRLQSLEAAVGNGEVVQAGPIVFPTPQTPHSSHPSPMHQRIGNVKGERQREGGTEGRRVWSQSEAAKEG